MTAMEKEHAKAHELLDEANVPKLDDDGELTLPERIEWVIYKMDCYCMGKTLNRKMEKNCSEK